MLFLTNYEIQYEVLKNKKKMMVLLTSSRHTWWRGIPLGSGWWCSRSVNLQKGAILWRLNYFYISMLTRGSTLQHLWTRPRRSSCERVVEVESRMSEYEDKRRRIKYSVSDRIPERALFFLDIGADLGIMGEGDMSKVWPRQLFVADSICEV